MYHLKLLLLMVLLTLYSTNADVAAQGGGLGPQLTNAMPLNRLRLLPNVLSASGLVADSNAILYLNSKHLDTHSNPPLRSYISPACLSEGRIADPDDCGQFYDCVRSRNGNFIASKQSCFGHAFDATLQSCIPAREAKGCVIDSTNIYRSATVEDPNLQKLCKSNNNEFICMDCKTLIMCVDRKPHIMPCKSGNVCYNDKESFNGGVCYPDAPLECTCDNDDIFRQDYYDPSKFLSCDTKGADPVVQSCPVGLEFNEQRRSCGSPIDTSCSESGTFTLKSDCTSYHTCIYTTNGWFQRNFTCTGNMMYNEQTGKCEDPCDWYDGNFICKEEGRFSNPEDCTTFFECIEDPLDANKFIQIEHVCPEGYEWLPMVNRYHCIAKGSTIGKCEPQKPNICEIPSEWCPSKTDGLSTTTTTKTSTTTTTTTTTTPPPPTVEDICNDAGGTLMGQQCLYFSSELLSCGNAVDTCNNIGGPLASIVDYNGVSAHIQNNYGSRESFWIGATSTYEETMGDGGNVMHLYMLGLQTSPHFSYHSCDEQKNYICEIEGISTSAAMRNVCPDDHFQVGSQCFFIPTEGFKTWYGAQELCMEQGGFLAEPDSIPEFHEALSKETSGYGFWLGGSNRMQGGNWRWSSREAMVGHSNSWYPGGPNLFDTSEKCLFLMRGVEKPLAARSCDVEHHFFICEKH